MNIYTIGFTKKSAEEFFELLQKNNIDCLVDIRLNNVSQLAGFTKSQDLSYFLKKIANIDYIHNSDYAPTKDILDNYKKGQISWLDYEKQYNKLIANRNVEKRFAFDTKEYKNVCLLCSEPLPGKCHRRLLAEYLQNCLNDTTVKHL